MPIYEYRCEQCGHVVEILQKVGARPGRKCEKCSGRLKKLISRTSFHLKGGGWYNEGYTKSSGGKSSGSKSAASCFNTFKLRSSGATGSLSVRNSS